jgi:hypothetical protein
VRRPVITSSPTAWPGSTFYRDLFVPFGHLDGVLAPVIPEVLALLERGQVMPKPTPPAVLARLAFFLGKQQCAQAVDDRDLITQGTRRPLLPSTAEA